MNLIFLVGSLVLFLLIIFNSFRKRKTATAPDISARKAHRLLMKHVRFYKELNRDEQASFRIRCKDFLDRVAITPVGKVKVKVLDRIYVAAAAIIPIFRYPDWRYNNLNEVLIYPGNFSKDFADKGPSANVMGMVGDGAMHRTMILSIGALRTGFEQADRGNTGIHEFVHLLDKADGAVDGIPEAMLPDELTKPWMEYMYRAIEKIRAGKTDINPYAATSEAEFFAVTSEYFFQRPDDFKEKHPELWAIMAEVYALEEPKEEKPD
jgi:Mlc titration factor MtfA (ptsG expression regulator)